ncbi:hypothetical protein [Demequina sp. NBRC 110057]|nr:hypothetical protein [Demequina sp. NBRC 110057]
MTHAVPPMTMSLSLTDPATRPYTSAPQPRQAVAQLQAAHRA